MKNAIYFLAVIIIVSCKPSVDLNIDVSENFRMNQLGYYPSSVKQFLLVDEEASNFEIVNSKGKSFYSGIISNNGTWELSNENVLMGDFSEFNKPGKYKIVVDGKYKSNEFEIKTGLYEQALRAAIKSYYFQRASFEIEEEFGGVYARKAGHLDDACIYHPSTGKDEGTLKSSGGWYDAGDYGKYIVNASLTVGQMLNFIEQYPNAIPDNSLNIPESGNNVSDLWDELKYELDWILSMQDDDGGVFFKLTAKKFGGFIMPEEYELDRYIIGKGTASALSFSAVLAQASRLYKNIDANWASKVLVASEKAYNWALENDNVAYKNPEDVSTGEYGDTKFDDDFYWASSELFLTTKNKEYLKIQEKYNQEIIHKTADSWKDFVRNVAFHSLLENSKVLNKEFSENLKNGQIKLANSILEGISKNPYRIGLESFVWGSNSDILNQAMILCNAHRISGEEKYLIGAEQITDYIFGKNATGYSFLTGFGTKRGMFPHHRPSGADGIANPVPGFILGGPNVDKQDRGNVEYKYPELPAKSFEDVEASFASNEVCINWNAPAVYVLGYIEQVRN